MQDVIKCLNLKKKKEKKKNKQQKPIPSYKDSMAYQLYQQYQ